MGREGTSGELILHFGMQKTGSSSIQLWLYRHLADPKFCYVHFGAANSSPMVVAGFSSKPAAFYRHRLEATPTAEIERLRANARERLDEELKHLGSRTGVVSAESLTNFTERELEGLCSEMERHGGRRIRAVGYLRRPREFMESAFQQRLKADLGELDIYRLYPEYARKLKKFDSVLGKSNVEIWLFEPKCFPGGCVVQDFCQRLGIAFSGSRVKRVNEALSLPAVSLLYAYRKYGPGFGTGPQAFRENELLVRALRELEGPKFRFHTSLVDPVLEAKRDDIKWAEERIGEGWLKLEVQHPHLRGRVST